MHGAAAKVKGKSNRLVVATCGTQSLVEAVCDAVQCSRKACKGVRLDFMESQSRW